MTAEIIQQDEYSRQGPQKKRSPSRLRLASCQIQEAQPHAQSTRPHHTSSTSPRQTGNQYRTALMHPSAHSVCVFHTRPNSYFQHVVAVTYFSRVCACTRAPCCCKRGALHCDREAVVASSQSFAEYGDAFQEKNVYDFFVAF
jgi:hypothetical protein